MGVGRWCGAIHYLPVVGKVLLGKRNSVHHAEEMDCKLPKKAQKQRLQL